MQGDVSKASLEGVLVDDRDACRAERGQVGWQRRIAVGRLVDGPVDDLSDRMPDTLEDGGMRRDARVDGVLEYGDGLVEGVQLHAEVDVPVGAVEVVQHRVGQVALRGLQELV